jgi:hypothetical protein
MYQLKLLLNALLNRRTAYLDLCQAIYLSSTLEPVHPFLSLGSFHDDSNWELLSACTSSWQHVILLLESQEQLLSNSERRWDMFLSQISNTN